MLGCIDQRHTQKCSKPAARANLCAGPVAITGPSLLTIELEAIEIDLPDQLFLRLTWKVEKERSVEPLGANKLRGQLAHVI